MPVSSNTVNALKTILGDGEALEVQAILNGALGSSLTLDDGDNIVLGTTTGSQLGTSSTQKLGLYGTTPVVQGAALTAQLTTITHTAPGTDDFAIQGITSTTPFGFVSADEGNTVLKVVANLQTRLAEVEARLETIGLVAAN